MSETRTMTSAEVDAETDARYRAIAAAHECCRESEAGPRSMEHECLPCPHGITKGGTYTVGRGEKIDAAQRMMKLVTLDRMTCEGHHPELLAVDGYGERTPGSHDIEALAAFVDAISPVAGVDEIKPLMRDIGAVVTVYCRQFRGVGDGGGG